MSTNNSSRIQPASIGSMNYHVLRSIIEELNILECNYGAEIGVLLGDTSSYLLEAFPSLTMLCIDPYLSYEEHQEERTQQKMNLYAAIAHERLSKFKDRAKLLRTTSLVVASAMRDNALDFVFIDAQHTYTEVMGDILAWYPKVRPGGLVAGHDFRWEGVSKAVVEFLEENNLEGNVTPSESDVWFLIKPSESNRGLTTSTDKSFVSAIETIKTRILKTSQK